jgi:hypothetical protein
VRSYLDAQQFRADCPAAFEKWTAAECLLWTPEVERDLTNIGHLCREAIQAFATAVVDRFQPSAVDPNKQHDVARIATVLDQRKAKLGSTERPFLSALLAYWGTVSDLAQRQEHGAQREAEPLVWGDARRLVFQTAVVTFETHRSLFRTS